MNKYIFTGISLLLLLNPIPLISEASINKNALIPSEDQQTLLLRHTHYG